MVYTRNENYRNKASREVDDGHDHEGAVAFAHIANNELDIYGVAAKTSGRSMPTPTSRSRSSTVRILLVGTSGFNNKQGSVQRQERSHRIAKSFDREAYVEGVQQRSGTPSTSFHRAGNPGADTGDTFQKFDITAAKASLAQPARRDRGAKWLKLTYGSSAAQNKTPESSGSRTNGRRISA